MKKLHINHITLFRTIGTIICVTMGVVIFVTIPIFAQSNGNYTLSWHTIDSGGGESSGANYAVAGTIGQPEVSISMRGGDYTVDGGFWEAGDEEPTTDPPVEREHGVYLPLVVKE